MRDLPRQFIYAQPEPANYPVVRQIVIVGIGLLLIFSGIFLSSSGSDTQKNNMALLDANPAEYTIIEDLPPTQFTPISNVSLEAQAAHVYDVEKNTVLYSQNADAVLPLASITKLMTVLLVAELLEDGSVITISAEAVAQYGNSGLRVGERVTAENLALYSLLSSSNDAAYALAISAGNRLFDGEGVTAFVDAMNMRAQELELTNTSFQNPTGLDISTIESGANGTAEDVTRLMQYLLEHQPELLAMTRASQSRVYSEGGGFHEAANTNPLISTIPNVIGSKTGFTDLAGGNLTIAFDGGFNRPIIITVLGSSFNGRFNDVQELIDATRTAWIEGGEEE